MSWDFVTWLPAFMKGIDFSRWRLYVRNIRPTEQEICVIRRMELIRENGSRLSGFVYQSHRIYPGKPKLEGLPATYVESDHEAETLEITLKDDIMGTELILTYTIYETFPVICRNARFCQTGKETVVLDRAMSFSLDLPDWDYDW